MKIPLSWLKEYVDIDISPQELAHKLTMSGTEVGSIDIVGDSWANIYVGRVISVDAHPNADRLQLATVNLDNEEITVVCGAPNLSQGQKIAFAKIGARLIDASTGNIETLKPATIRGVVSSGMICSEIELGLSDDHSGIVVLPEDAQIGKPLYEYMGDFILDLELTPNRPDCLSVLGVAREIAALTNKVIKEPELSFPEDGDPIEDRVSVEIINPVLSPRYTASIVEGIKVGPSPRWMQDRLLKAGQRPISNVVDVTNYVMLEYGQPLHAFDYTTLKDRKIIVRPALDKEVFVSLDDVQRELKPPMLVIADTQKSVGLAGIIGGLNSEMTNETTTVLLESANFDAINTRRTAQELRLRSEASSRFDKGIQPELAIIALKRATQLILQLAGGKACKGTIDAYPQPKSRPVILFTTSRLEKVLGIKLPLKRIGEILKSLGFSTSNHGRYAINVTVPYWRSDITQEDDLVEEIARIIGYDNLPTTTLSTPIPTHKPQPDRELREHVKDIMVACGMQEVISHSLTSLKTLERTQVISNGPQPLRLANPMSEEQEYLRTTLRGSIISTLAINQNNVRDGIKLFEVGRVYISRDTNTNPVQPHDLPIEREILIGLVAGPRWSENWLGDGENLDFFDAKGILETFLGRLGVRSRFEPIDDPIFLPGRSATIIANESRLGVIGELHTKTLEQFQIDMAPVALFEVDLYALLDVLPMRSSQYHQIPRYPGAYRNLAIVLSEEIPSANVQEIIERNPLAAQVNLFDVYQGSGVSDGTRSLAYSILFQLPDRTLVGEEVSQALEEIIATLKRETGAKLRS